MKYYINQECTEYLDSLNSIPDTSLYSDFKILIVAGDSWTNVAYIPEDYLRWPYLVGKKGNYDCVFNLSTDYGSNSEIYQSLLKFISNEEPKPEHCQILRYFKSENIDIVITWSTPIRDKDEISILYRPYKTATIPDVEDVNLNSKIFRKYYEDWFREEHHSYKTQLYTLFLQEYCKEYNLNINFSMGFTSLVEDSFKDTKWDLRKHIDEDSFFGLYGYPSCLQDFIISKEDSSYKDKAPIIEMQYIDNEHPSFWNIFNRIKPKKETLEKRKTKIGIVGNHHQEEYIPMFTSDGHPAIKGNIIISELIHSFKKGREKFGKSK